MLPNEKELYDLLNNLEINYKTYEHEPVFTVDEALELTKEVPGAHIKNLFLKDDNKKFWLVSALFDTKIGLKDLSKIINAPGLRFAQPELLEKYLGVIPGSVTPLALINDKNHEVNIVFDKKIFDNDICGVHPLRNNATTVISPNDLEKFVNKLGNNLKIISFDHD